MKIKTKYLLRKFANETIEGSYTEKDIEELTKALYKAITEDWRWPKGLVNRPIAWHQGIYAAESALAEILEVKE